MSDRLAGKVAVITGGARGIGAATARRFVNEGASVVITDILEPEGKEVADELKALGGRAEFVRCNVANSDEVKNVISTAVRLYGKLNILFNNAGVVTPQLWDVANCPEDVFDKVMAINVKGYYLGIKHAIPEMIKNGGGSIINTGSTTSLVGVAGTSAYCVSKGAVLSLTRVAALDYAKWGIRVNAIAPGVVETPIYGEGMQGLSPEERNEQFKAFVSTQPINRVIRADEVASLVLFLASDEASMITGSIYPVDGGFTVH